MVERSLVLIKPDAVERNLIGRILSIYEENGLKIVAIKGIKAPKSVAELHYAEHNGRPYFEELINYITRSPIVALVLEGENAIKQVRRLNGCTNPNDAEEGTIRKLFAMSKNENSVHGSDCIENAKREISIWFPAV